MTLNLNLECLYSSRIGKANHLLGIRARKSMLKILPMEELSFPTNSQKSFSRESLGSLFFNQINVKAKQAPLVVLNWILQTLSHQARQVLLTLKKMIPSYKTLAACQIMTKTKLKIARLTKVCLMRKMRWLINLLRLSFSTHKSATLLSASNKLWSSFVSSSSLEGCGL